MDKNMDLEELYASKLSLADKLIEAVGGIRRIQGATKLQNRIIKEKMFLLQDNAFVNDVINNEAVGGIRRIQGATKLQNRIIKEKMFLLQVKNNGKACKEHFMNTNLIHYDAIVSTILADSECDSVLKRFTFSQGQQVKTIIVDVVSNRGMKWTKVIARNPKSMTMSSIVDNKFGERTLLDQGVDFLECAKVYPAFFMKPEVVFKFTSGVVQVLGEKLLLLGIKVSGNFIGDSNNVCCDMMENIPPKLGECSGQGSIEVYTTNIQKLNLDITAMIALVSEMTNTECRHTFRVSALNEQCKAEETVKVKEILENLFDGKELLCCEAAANGFIDIVNTVGGDKEKIRAQQLLTKITVVKDSISHRVKHGLQLTGKIKKRSLTIFGTGDMLEAMTVSANYGFIRSAQKRGIELVAFIHEPRALSERAHTIET